MAIQKTKLESKPNWKIGEYNRWADYIELMCLKDEMITPDDMMDILRDGDNDNEYDRGGDTHLEKANELENQMKDYFTLVKSRSREYGAYYPFLLEAGNCIKRSPEFTEKQKQYIFLLACSSICFMKQTDMQKYTTEFERFSKTVLPMLVPSDAVVELFGTKREESGYTGTLRARIEMLAKKLGANTTKSFDHNSKYDKIKAGDDGLDIVAFLPVDQAQAIPFAFAQCTCSYDKWKEKQDTVSMDYWNTKIEPLISYPIFMFVPFSCHNNAGKFYDVTNLRSFLIDRDRIIKLIDKNCDEVFQKEINAFCQKVCLDELFS
ncbi:MAG: hypothetical protein IJ567_09545 [Lachnospiraceae bacterium]|nr:hypothetical protein [Lachnospiraceae bacterium]